MVHLAGNCICIGRRVIQRCMACGYKLIDLDLDRVAVAQMPGREHDVGAWEFGALVQVEGINPVHSALVGTTYGPHIQERWDGCCVQSPDEDHNDNR